MSNRPLVRTGQTGGPRGRVWDRSEPYPFSGRSHHPTLDVQDLGMGPANDRHGWTPRVRVRVLTDSFGDVAGVPRETSGGPIAHVGMASRVGGSTSV